MDIEERLKELPDSPGVYLMKNGEGQIIYVGKASSIKKRVSSYFYPSRQYSARTEVLISHTKHLDYIPTGSVAEAMLLEASLVKESTPRYNVALKDDKAYPFLKLTINEDFPRLFIARRKKEDGARYYGPYTEAKLLRKALASMRKIFPLRTCRSLPNVLCLNYHLKQCLGPCVGKIAKTKYRKIVEELCLFLEGRRDELLGRLSRKMREAADRKDFEEAARIRDQIGALTRVVTGPRRLIGFEEIEELKELLNLPTIPRRIEAFDVSNIFGAEAVGSMVLFSDGRPDRSGYRRFRIKEVVGIDDYRMIRELVSRRYKRALEEKGPLPELIIIDGGKGQVGSARDELRNLGLDHISVMGIAKEFEHIYLPGRKEPIVLPSDSKVLHLIERIRNEAHRFAISYHRLLRRGVIAKSELDKIPGIGKKRKVDLISRFGSVDNIKKAKVEDLMKVEGVGRNLAEEIVRYFEGNVKKYR